MRTLPSPLVALTLATAACDAAFTSPQDAPPIQAAVGSGRSVTGSGHTILANGDQRNFTFHAKIHPDGSVSGSYRLALHSIDAWFTVDVSCLVFDGNTAWVAGHISDTNVPNLIRVGSVSYFYAIDGGEGAGTIDKVSRARTNDALGQDAVFCATKPLALFDPNPLTVVSGNVQVR